MLAAPPPDIGANACPGCLGPLALQAASCPSCGVPLTGPLVDQLRQLDRRITDLRSQRSDLLAALRASAPAAGPAGDDGSAPAARPGRRMGGSAHAPASGVTDLVVGHPPAGRM